MLRAFPFSEDKWEVVVLYAKELPVAIHQPGRLFAEFSIEMDLKPKTLNDVVDVFDVYNVNLITGLVMGNLREDRRILEAFVDCTEASISVGRLPKC